MDAFDPLWLSPFNPLRPVDWRWQCAQSLAAANSRTQATWAEDHHRSGCTAGSSVFKKWGAV